MPSPARIALMTTVALLTMQGGLRPAAPAAAEEPDHPFAHLAWLAGCWERASDTAVACEQWFAPTDNLMLGLNVLERDGQTVAYEYLRIEVDGDRLVYTALPSGQTETSFHQVELTDSLAVFANPDHDFPQLIRYRLLPDGSLLAQIEGEMDGATRVVDFPFERVPCDRERP